jgi:hypothetical protein
MGENQGVRILDIILEEWPRKKETFEKYLGEGNLTAGRPV